MTAHLYTLLMALGDAVSCDLDNYQKQIDAIECWVERRLAKERLEEAKWWAAGEHAAKYDDSGCETENCRQCKRIAELTQAAERKP